MTVEEQHLVLYRKHRPREFGELVGQDHVVAAITKAIATGRVAHAYLFCGPRGVGKTTTARLIAKALQCESTTEKPCNKCARCIEFNEGRAMDLIEIDGASNRNIDDIRELRDAVRFVPVQGKKKVYIIDEVHMLTQAAFNALLKTLEEPPPHVVFVLATTEQEKVPATIVSRTQRYDFRRPTVEDITHRLAEVAKREKITLDADGAKLIALVAEGSMRDAESVLGQVMAVADKKIGRADVEETLGLPKREAAKQIFSLIAKKDTPAALAVVENLMDAGHDPALFLRLLLRYMRAALLLKVAPNLAHTVQRDFLTDEYECITSHLPGFTHAELSRAAESLAQYQYQFKHAPIPQLPLELAVIELTSAREGSQAIK